MFSWQQKNWSTLTDSLKNQRLGHGLLFHGAAGIGKNTFALEFAHWLMCEQPLTDSACGQCKSCNLNNAHSNPDLLMIEPEEEGKAIKVDQIRDLIQKVSLTSHSQNYRVIIISPADALNINASNSLLKTLEEPPNNTILILVSDAPSKLMATIRSRTQMVRFDLPSEQESLEWLQQQNIEQPELVLKLNANAPLSALSMSQGNGLIVREQLFNNWQALAEGNADALESAAIWLKEGFKVLGSLPLQWVSSWITDMIRTMQGGHIESMSNMDYAQTLQKLARQVDLKSMYGLLDRLNDTIQLMDSPANQQTLIESLLLHWSGLKRS